MLRLDKYLSDCGVGTRSEIKKLIRSGAVRVDGVNKATPDIKIDETSAIVYLNGQIIQEFENGDFEFCFSAPEHETFWYGVILAFGNKVKIIEPQEIKERIIKTCKEIQMEYGE